MTEREVKQWKAFVNDPANALHCSQCPANEGRKSEQDDRLPCGQFNCWVTVTCR